MPNPQTCTLLFPNTDLTTGFLPFVAVVVISRGNPENKVARIFWKGSDLKQWIHYPSNTTALQVSIFTLMMTNTQALFVGRTGSSYACCQIYWWVEGAEMKFFYYSIQKELCKDATYQSEYWDGCSHEEDRISLRWRKTGRLALTFPVRVDLGLCTLLWVVCCLVCTQGCWENSRKVTHTMTDMPGALNIFQLPSVWLNTNPVKMKMTLLLWNRCFKTSNASPQELEFSENCFRIWELAISRPVLSNPHLTVATTGGWLWHDSVSKNDPSSPVAQIWTVEKVRRLQIREL